MNKHVMVAAILSVTLSSNAYAECNRWSLNGELIIQQSNNIPVTVDLVQSGNRLSGTAKFYSTSLSAYVGGPLEGFVNGNDFRFRVNWYLLDQECLRVAGMLLSCREKFYDETGVYEGSINQNGEMEGVTFPFERASARANWFATRLARCADFAWPSPSDIDQLGSKSSTPHTAPGERIDVGSTSREAPPVMVRVPNSSDRARDPGSIADVTTGGRVGGAGRETPPVMYRAPNSGVIARDPGSIADVTSSGSVGGALCRDGLIPRRARPDDVICVTRDERARVQQENSDAPRNWVEGAYGPNTCRSGLVWREAFSGDTVCVTPERRQEVRRANAS